MAQGRDEYIIASLPTQEYNDDGRLITTGTSTIEFYGCVEEMKSDLSVGGGKRRNELLIMIQCDSVDIENLTIDHTLTIDGADLNYQVVDIYDSTLKYTAEIIAKYTK